MRHLASSALLFASTVLAWNAHAQTLPDVAPEPRDTAAPTADAEGATEADAAPASSDVAGRPAQPADEPPAAAREAPGQDAPAAETTREAPDQETPVPAPLLADDSLRGRLVLSLGGGVSAPYGALERSVPWRDAAATGASGVLELGVGLSRATVAGVWGTAAGFPSASDCSTCSTTSYAGGAFLRYHLVQGLRFDPWVSFGAGARALRVRNDADFDYTAVDWLRLTVGGDWYVVSRLAFGPYLGLVGGATVDRPDTPPVGERPLDDRGAVYVTVDAGLRLTLTHPSR